MIARLSAFDKIPLLIAIPYWEGDYKMMRKLVQLIVGMQEKHAGRECAFLMVSRQDFGQDEKAIEHISSRFNVFTYKSRSPLRGWPQGCNGMFSSTLIHVSQWMADKVEAVYWLEADCVPLHPKWIERLLKAWNSRGPGKKIVGHMVRTDPAADDSLHVNGSAIYDGHFARDHTWISQQSGIAWDWACRHAMVKLADNTPEIIMWYKAEKIKADRLQGVAASVIHGVKDDSLLKIVAKRNGGIRLDKF